LKEQLQDLVGVALPLKLDAFPLQEAERETPTRWGVRTAGDLARLRRTI